MAYKKDINLFKAAGGSTSKGKKMPLTKKLLITLLLVTIVCGAVIGVLVYMNNSQEQKLKGLKDKADAYEFTKRITADALQDYTKVLMERAAIDVIEYYNESFGNIMTCLSEKEIAEIKNYINSTEVYTTDYSFADVGEGILQKIAVEGYTLSGDASLNDINFIYSAIANMNTNYALYEVLPDQVETDDMYGIWYSYFRGHLVMVLKGGTEDGVTLLKDALTTKETVNVDPFMKVVRSADSGTETLTSSCSLVVTLEEGSESETYTVLCIARKTIFERLIDVIEARIDQALENSVALTEDDMTYSIDDIAFNRSSGTIEFSLTMYQSEEYGFEQVCQAIDESDFFEAESTLSFPTTSTEKRDTKELTFKITNSAYELMDEVAQTHFVSSSDYE